MDAQTAVALVLVALAATWLVRHVLRRVPAARACRDCPGCAPPPASTPMTAARPGARALPALEPPRKR